MKEPQLDAHCTAFDQHLWQDWPPEEITPQVIPIVSHDVDEALCFYVVAKSDTIENLYLSHRGWEPLGNSTSKFSRTHVVKYPEPRDGFWMPLERAQELEQ